MKAPEYLRKEIASAVVRLDRLTDVTDSRCSIDPEHKEAVRLYVQSWIREPLAELLEVLEGNRPHDRAFLSPLEDRDLEAHDLTPRDR